MSTFTDDVNKAIIANLSRRTILGTGMGLGAVAMAEMLGGGFARGAAGGNLPVNLGPDKGTLGTGQIPAKAKRVVQMHMWGAVSQVDTFDYKPTLFKMHGQEIPPTKKNKGGHKTTQSNGQSSFPLVKPF